MPLAILPSKPLMLALSSALAVLMLACGGEAEAEATESSFPTTDTVSFTGPLAALALPFFELRERPEADSRALGQLRRGDELQLLGPVSERATRLRVQGEEQVQPWLLVRDASGREGWVHAAAFGDELPETLRLRLLLGEDLAGACADYAAAFGEMDSQASVLKVLRQAHHLAAALSLAAEQQPQQQWAWLQALLPALQQAWLEDEGRHRFFVDYRAFGPAAAKTGDRADDALLALYYATYPLDSIGYRFPAWALEAEAGKAYSLLGRGLHHQLLGRLDEALVYQDAIRPEIDQLKAWIINDMVGTGVLYWEHKDKAAEEVRRIQTAGFSLLSPEEAARLERRAQWMADSLPENDQRFNHRAGVHAATAE